jgi:uncharacterized damage-inducible protein DinB
VITKQNLLQLFKREFATTLRVMRAFPEDNLTFVPHERSSTARNVIRTFIFEMYLIESYVFGEKIDRSVFQTYAPDKLETLVADFEKETARVISSLDKLPEADFNKTVEFAGKKMAADEFMLMMLFDQIHHRGQLTVYIRMAGGKVPSVYGPSADDQSANL